MKLENKYNFSLKNIGTNVIGDIDNTRWEKGKFQRIPEKEIHTKWWPNEQTSKNVFNFCINVLSHK